MRSSDKLSIIDFRAEWCGPCLATSPVIEELAEDYSDKINIGKINVDKNPELVVSYGINNIPSILFIKNDKMIDKHVGVASKALLEKKIREIL